MTDVVGLRIEGSMLLRNLCCSLTAVLVSVVLTACAHPQLMELQAPSELVSAELGTPDVTVKLGDGGERWVYSMQPMSQQVWWLTFDAEGHLVGKEEVLNREHFALIRPGVSTREDVYALFGKCAQKFVFHLSDQTAWMYRFLDDGIFYMACWVQFDMKGVVTEVGYTTDPWHDRDSDVWP